MNAQRKNATNRDPQGNAPPDDDGLRKAAILVAGLDRASADAMLEALGPELAPRVRRLVVELGRIDPKEQRRIIDEFFNSGSKTLKKASPGLPTDKTEIELDEDPTQRPSTPRTGHPPLAPPTATATLARPFRFLHETETDNLTRVLAAERPQTIALVISHLPPERAGNVLARLQAALQVEVIQRLANLEEIDPEILREVEGALQLRLSQQVPMKRRHVAGMKAVAEILRAADARLKSQILDNLGTHDRSLAERLSPPPISFADLLQLDDDHLGNVLRAAGPELTMTALVGAPPQLIDRVLHRLPAAEAQDVRRRLDHPGPIRLSDVEAARQEIAETAQRLSAKPHVRPPHDQPILVS